MSIDLTVFSDEELTQLINEVAQEQERRKQEGYISYQVSERIAPIADALVESSPEILENAPQLPRTLHRASGSLGTHLTQPPTSSQDALSDTRASCGRTWSRAS